MHFFEIIKISKFFILFLLLSVPGHFAWAQSVDTKLNNPDKKIKCKHFKTGRFELENELGKYIIQRNETVQFEKSLFTGDSSSYSVTWVGECAYELRIIGGGEEEMEFYKNQVLLVTILETYSDGYKCEAQLQGTELKIPSFVLKKVGSF